MKAIYLLITFVFFSLSLGAQIGDDRFELLAEKMEQFSKQQTNLNKKIDISALGTIPEIIAAIAQQTKINITVDPQIQDKIVSNFSKVKVQDLLLYLCKQYDLDLSFSGSIISVFRYKAPVLKPKEKEKAKFNPFNSRISIDLQNDTLETAAREMAKASGQNIIVSKNAKNQIVSAFVDKTSLEDALNMMARSNDLKISKTPEGAFYISMKEEEDIDLEDPNARKGNSRLKKMGAGIDYQAIKNLSIVIYQDSSITEDWLIDVEAANVPFLDVIKGVSIELGRDYFLFEDNGGRPLKTGKQSKYNNNQNNNNQNGGISLKLEGATYEEFLDYILKGTELTYKIDEGIYLIGDRNREGLRDSKVIQLQNRSANEIEKIIPPELQEGVEVSPFLELNAVVVSGSAPAVAEIEEFLKSIDKLVPVVNIELIIMDVQRNLLNESGLEMGVGENPAQDQATLTPGLDFSFGANTINRLLNTLAGQGIVNLGQVVPNFYVSLRAVEDAGVIKTRSRPQLSTLNSHEASFTVGETRYYQETTTTVQGNQAPVTQQAINFKSVQANFTITMTPFVSGDEQITMDVVVTQSDFAGEVQLGAPPAQFSRTFDSEVRVRNGEMIVLGGLDTKRREQSSRGAPFLARIPILKLLGNRKKTKSDTELLVFIKPTIVY